SFPARPSSSVAQKISPRSRERSEQTGRTSPRADGLSCLDEETPLPQAKHGKVPTMMAQLRRDFLVHAEADGQAIFNALGADEKELLWIEESNQRFYASNHFGQHPERLLGWFAKHM